MDEKDEKKDKNISSSETSTHASSTPVATDVESVHRDGAESVSGESIATSEPVPEGGHVKEKTGALVGKINNLVTTDLSIIEDSYRVVEIRSYSHISLCEYPNSSHFLLAR